MKTHPEVQNEVHELISRVLKQNQEAITDESRITDLSEDSIQLFELLITFEKFYEMSASYDDVVRLNTVGDIVSYIASTKYSLK